MRLPSIIYLKIFILCVIIISVAVIMLQFWKTDSNGFLTSTPYMRVWNHSIDFDEKISIGFVACSGGSISFKKIKDTVLAASKEPLTLIKSVLISAKIGRAKWLEFHIFTDHRRLKLVFLETIAHFNQTFAEYLRITVQFYNVFHSVPKEYERDLVDSTLKCTFVRIFFPYSLAVDLNQILYLDTDVIITGNITEIWKSFKEKVINTNRNVKLAAMVPNSEVVGNNYVDVYNSNFGGIPHVKPRGVNAGVMFMNLEGMRKVNWTGDMLKLFERWELIGTNDQRLINIYFHDHPEKLEIFPCQWNFQHLHCEKGLSCKSAATDPNGIRIMHGAGHMFQKRDGSHSRLFQSFKSFNMEDHQTAEKNLLKPLVEYYGKSVVCAGSIGKLLFKGMLT